MTIWRLNNATLLGGEVCAQWQANHAYSLGARCVCTVGYGTVLRRALVFECTTAGTSGATEPAWPTSGTRTDGPDTLVWTVRNPNDGNWDNASCFIHYLMNHAAVAAGDFIYVNDDHNETAYAAIIILGKTSASPPLKIVCVDKATDALSTGAIISNSSGNIEFRNVGYSYGVTYKPTSNIYTASTSTYWILEGNGTTVIDLDTSGATIQVGGASFSAYLLIINGNIDFANANSQIVVNYRSYFAWCGGTLIAANGVTDLFFSQYSLQIDVSAVDLSDVGNGAAATALIDASGSYIYAVLFERCKLPSDAGFVPVTNVPFTGLLNKKGLRFHHCSPDNKTYDFYEVTAEGSIVDETTIVRSGGASDGTTPQSRKMISSSTQVTDNFNFLRSPPVNSWTNAITSKTFSVECLVDSAANLQNDEVWMEFEYPVDNSSGLGGFARDKCAMLAAPAEKSAGVGAGSWATGGMGNPNSFKCSVTVTPGKPGPITARICLAKASTTIYYDPIIMES